MNKLSERLREVANATEGDSNCDLILDEAAAALDKAAQEVGR